MNFFTVFRLNQTLIQRSAFLWCHCVGLFCALFYLPSIAQTTTSASIQSSSSVVSLNPSNVIMERRGFSTAFPMTVPPPTYITVQRTNATGAAVVLLSADYRTASGTVLTNAQLQVDLGAHQLSIDNSGLGANVLFFEPGQTLGHLVFYPTRVNFQKNEDRILTVKVLPARRGFGQPYTIESTLGTITLTLRDNQSGSSQPFLLNAVQNTSMTNGSLTLLELESPGFRGDGFPERVFVNENGSPLTYSTASLNPDIVRAEVVPAQARQNNLSGLRLTAVSTGKASIMVVAVDDKRRAATTFFDVNVQVAVPQVATSVRNAASHLASVVCSPNPAHDVLLVSGIPTHAECRIITSVGQERLHWTAENASEIISLKELPHGAYFLVVEHLGKRSITPVLHQ
ncbi:MAG: hypothetical protein EAZ92_06050 [Candidatus Kapaibacterium sp.]|nr:MAG: hypothetical protein EAZ92_06050 [Candidatus Kapabacteria bacterium]